MNRLDEPHALNRDALLATIYEIQTDLKMLTDWLARERDLDLSDHAILDLAWLRVSLQQRTPSLRRH